MMGMLVDKAGWYESCSLSGLENQLVLNCGVSWDQVGAVIPIKEKAGGVTAKWEDLEHSCREKRERARACVCACACMYK
jgi:hypothetical protein